MNDNKKLGVIALAGVVISAMLGGGVYNLPQNMAQSASAGAILISWIITGIGIWFIANTFRILAAARPDATTGIYTYGELGFGKFTGFLMAWGYWICNSFANVGYAVLLMDSLNYFFPPYFKGGNNWLSIACGSLVLWIIFFIVLAGVKQASALNVIGTIGKLLPLAIFLLVLLFSFKFSTFFTDFWGLKTVAKVHDTNLGGILPQVKSTMLVTLWVFTGIEGAVVVSGRAKSQKDVSKATFLGFITCLLIYTLLSLLPLGVYSQGEISKMAPPSTAAVLMDLIGNWGSVIMNLGVIIAILSSWLIWTVMLSQLPFAAAQSGTFPKIFAKENKNGAPVNALLITNILVQLFLISMLFTQSAYQFAFSLASSAILYPYMFSAFYQVKYTLEHRQQATTKQWTIGIIASIYAIWIIYAAGINYLLLTMLLYIPALLVYSIVQKNNQTRLIKSDYILFMIIIVLAVIGLIKLLMGTINVF